MKRKVKIMVIIVITIVVIVVGFVLAYRFNYIAHCKFSNEHFGIEQYVSEVDADNDGIDDQTDILNGAKSYLATKPKYKSKYYSSGYPDDEYGVCTDVVAKGLLEAGYDLQLLVNKDIQENPMSYNIDSPDKNIDFRRVVNLNVYFSNNAILLTKDISEVDEWQAGDIIVWEHHIGIISDSRNAKGNPFVLHHSSKYQASYEEDILSIWGKIIGHYRMT